MALTEGEQKIVNLLTAIQKELQLHREPDSAKAQQLAAEIQTEVSK